jgi:hypothetical protein
MCVVERLVELSRDPQVVQEHRELPRHGHRSPFLGVLAATGGYLFPVAPEVRVRAEGTQDVVGATDQELTLSISSPSLEMRFWGSMSPDRSVAGTSPRYAPTERLLSKRWGSSRVSTNVSAVSGPLPSTCLKRSVSG